MATVPVELTKLGGEPPAKVAEVEKSTASLVGEAKRSENRLRVIVSVAAVGLLNWSCNSTSKS